MIPHGAELSTLPLKKLPRPKQAWEEGPPLPSPPLGGLSPRDPGMDTCPVGPANSPATNPWGCLRLRTRGVPYGPSAPCWTWESPTGCGFFFVCFVFVFSPTKNERDG